MRSRHQGQQESPGQGDRESRAGLGEWGTAAAAEVQARPGEAGCGAGRGGRDWRGPGAGWGTRGAVAEPAGAAVQRRAMGEWVRERLWTRRVPERGERRCARVARAHRLRGVLRAEFGPHRVRLPLAAVASGSLCKVEGCWIVALRAPVFPRLWSGATQNVGGRKMYRRVGRMKC